MTTHGTTTTLPADVEARATRLWATRHAHTAAERAQVERLPDPYRSTFAANALWKSGRRIEALDLALRLLPLFPEPSPWRGHLLRLQAGIYAALRLVDQAVETNRQAQQSARACGDDITYASCLQDLSTYPHQPWEHVDELLREAREIGERAGGDHIVVLVDFNRAWWDMLDGGPTDRVLAGFEAVERHAELVWPDLAVEARACRVVVAARAGRWDVARPLAALLPGGDDIVDEETRTAVARARAWVLADDGLVDDAEDVLTRLLEEVSEERRYDLLSTLTDVLAHAGRYAAAWSASQRLVDVVRRNADSLGHAQARALQAWYRTREAEQAHRRETKQADVLRDALERLAAAEALVRELSGGTKPG